MERYKFYILLDNVSLNSSACSTQYVIPALIPQSE